MTLFEQRYGLRLRIQNPNDRAIPVKGLSYSLQINGEEFAYGVSAESTTVPAFGEALLDVDATSSTLNVIKQFKSISGSTVLRFDYQLSGKLKVSNHLMSVPFNYGGTLELPQAGQEPASH